MVSAVDKQPAAARLSAVAAADCLPTAATGSQSSYTTSRDTTPICDTMAQEIESADHCNQVLWDCARCGKYWLLASSRSPIRNCDLEGRAKISGFVYDQNRNGSEPKLTCDLLEQVMSRPFPTVGERAERLLTEVVRCQNHRCRQKRAVTVCIMPSPLGWVVASGGNILPDIHPPPCSRPGSTSRRRKARGRIAVARCRCGRLPRSLLREVTGEPTPPLKPPLREA